jgi:hypothetical protein
MQGMIKNAAQLSMKQLKVSSKNENYPFYVTPNFNFNILTVNYLHSANTLRGPLREKTEIKN